MKKSDAAACWKILSERSGAPDDRRWGSRYLELTRTLATGTPMEQAHKLHRLYREQRPLPDTHKLMIERYEERLLVPLARALEKPLGQVRSGLHRGQPAFAAEAPYRKPIPIPPKPAELRLWSEGLGFYVHGAALVFGEEVGSNCDAGPDLATANRDRPSIVVPALNGPWLVLHRPAQISDHHELYDVTQWVMVHASAVARTEQLVADAEALGSLSIDGGRVLAVDAEVRDDEAIVKDIDYEEATGRGLLVNLGGDGSCAIWGSRDSNGALVLAWAHGVYPA
jgi:hypothetical protein